MINENMFSLRSKVTKIRKVNMNSSDVYWKKSWSRLSSSTRSRYMYTYIYIYKDRKFEKKKKTILKKKFDLNMKKYDICSVKHNKLRKIIWKPHELNNKQSGSGKHINEK